MSKELSKKKKGEISKKKREVTKLKELLVELNTAKVHHNFRRDDGCGRIYCSDCGSRDFDSLIGATVHFVLNATGKN